MHCASCEILIEDTLKNVEGVISAKVNYADGTAELTCSRIPTISELQESIAKDGYTIEMRGTGNTTNNAETKRTGIREYVEIGGIVMILYGIYFLLSRFDIIPKLALSDTMSLWFVFGIGLVAAFSTCLAVAGGLLISLAATYTKYTDSSSPTARFIPHIYFNVGRIISYTLCGGLIGALGSAFTISPRANGILTIMVSVLMILLGIQLLHLFPSLSRFYIRMPSFITKKAMKSGAGSPKYAPFFIGASTFFLPCGFTQALQLYVLSKGSAFDGAMIMLAFSLGTLPALMSISVISSFARGGIQKYFLKFSGIVVLVIGIFSFQNGLTIAGVREVTTIKQASVASGIPSGVVRAIIENNIQIVTMQVSGVEYSPHQFVVQKGIPVEWRIDGRKAQGCAQTISVPTLGIVKYLSPSTTTLIQFTPQQIGTIPFSCTMGMTTRGSTFYVVDSLDASNGSATCNPKIQDCI